MAKITIKKKYFHDYTNPTKEDKYHVEHDVSGSLETIVVDSIEELIKRVLNEYTSQGYTVRTFEVRLNKGNETLTDDLYICDKEMVKINVETVK